MYNKKEINSKPIKVPTLAKKPNPFKDDVIVDPKGQWAHPGEITKIPSNKITMKGVNYPVLGVDNLGNKKMMKPGMDYTFPGQNVTEYPQMKSGGWLDGYNQGGPHYGTPPEHDDSITHDDGFRTWNLGQLEGKPENAKMKKVIQSYRDDPDKKVPGGESYSEFLNRITPTYNKTLENSPDKSLIVTHSEVIKGLGLPKLKPGEVYPVNADGKTIYITRHGDTYQNNTTPGDALVRTKDAQLAPEGIKEAKKNAKVLASKDITNIVSSPLPRAITTAEIIHKGLEKKQQGGGWLPEKKTPLLPNIPEDKRQLPQSGVVVDKRSNTAYYTGNKGEAGSFPVLTGKNVDMNSHPFSLEELEKNPQLRNTPVGYYKLQQEFKDKKDPYYKDYLDPHYKGMMRSIDPISAFGEPAPVANDLAFHRTYNEPGDPSVFKNREKKYSCPPGQRYGSYGCVNIQEEGYQAINKALPDADTLMVLDSKRLADKELLKKMQARMPKKEGGGSWVYNDDFYKKGGPTSHLQVQKQKKGRTSKNIQSSINEIFLRNYTIFGPSGHNIYDHKLKYETGGGWLDNYK